VTKDLGSGLVLVSHHEDTVARIADSMVRFKGHGVLS
jgi:hypothetical protein